jgi:DNA-binding LacI/PurR family transcriptional regulator
VKQHRPDAIVSFVSRAYEWLIEAGYRVPEDVAFACFGVWPHEPFTGFAVPHEELGRATVDFLIEQLHANQHGFPEVRQTVRHERRWVEGRTLPPVERAGGGVSGFEFAGMRAAPARCTAPA